MAEKEYIAGDPSDIQNVYRTLKDISILQTNTSKVGKEILNIHQKLTDSLVNQTVAEKELYKVNVSILDKVALIKSLEDRKLRGIISQKYAQEQLLKAYREMNTLVTDQKMAEEKVTSEKAKQGKGQQFLDILGKSIFNGQSKYLAGLQSILKVWGETASVVLVLYEVGKQIFQIFENLDESAMEFRKEMGFTRKFTADIDKYARDAAISLARLGVTGKEAYAAVVGISKELYTSMTVTPALVKNIALLSAQLGISEGASAELLRNLAIVSRTTAGMQMDAVLFTTSLSEAAGTPLKDVMADISNTTKSMYQFVSRSGIELIKAAVEARRMGTSLESSTKTSASLLNFTQNVKDEMEASVLLGKSINLQKARELAYHRDIRGLNKEILNIIKQTDFENLDPFQQDAVARALGKSADELANMAQAERERLNIERAMTPEQQKQHKIFQEMLSATTKQAKNYAEIAQQTLLQEGNQTRLKNIANSWHAIIAQIAGKLLPIIDVSLKFVADHFNIILGISSMVFAAFGFIGKMINIGLIRPMIFFGKLLQKIPASSKMFGWLGKVGKSLESVGVGISRVFTGVMTRISSLASKLLKILAPVFFIFHIVEEIKKILGDKELMSQKGFWNFNGHLILRAFGAIARAFWKTLNDLFFDIPNMIVKGLASVGNMLSDSITKPFKAALDWLHKWFLGNSPSQIGLMIVEGLVAVESMIMNALISPFKKAWEFIKNLPLISHLFGGKGLDTSITPDAQTNVTVERPSASFDSKKSPSSLSTVIDSMNDELTKQMAAVVDAVNGLRDDMRNGSITSTVYLDSQKLDAAIGRRLGYTGALV